MAKYEIENSFSCGAAPLRLATDLEKVAGDALDGIIDGKNVNAFAIFDVGAGLHHNHVTETNTQVFAHSLVHANFALLDCLIREDDTDSILALLSLDEDSIATEQAELLHGIEMQGNNAVVVIGSFIHNQTIRVLLLQRRRCCTTFSVTARRKDPKSQGSSKKPTNRASPSRGAKKISWALCENLLQVSHKAQSCLLPNSWKERTNIQGQASAHLLH